MKQTFGRSQNQVNPKTTTPQAFQRVRLSPKTNLGTPSAQKDRTQHLQNARENLRGVSQTSQNQTKSAQKEQMHIQKSQDSHIPFTSHKQQVYPTGSTTTGMLSQGQLQQLAPNRSRGQLGAQNTTNQKRQNCVTPQLQVTQASAAQNLPRAFSGTGRILVSPSNNNAQQRLLVTQSNSNLLTSALGSTTSKRGYQKEQVPRAYSKPLGDQLKQKLNQGNPTNFGGSKTSTMPHTTSIKPFSAKSGGYSDSRQAVAINSASNNNHHLNVERNSSTRPITNLADQKGYHQFSGAGQPHVQKQEQHFYSDSEYASVGRVQSLKDAHLQRDRNLVISPNHQQSHTVETPTSQNQKVQIKFYGQQSSLNGSSSKLAANSNVKSQNEHSSHLRMGHGAATGSVNTRSDEMSEEFQAVAEEDMGSFIKHRNDYLDGEIQTTESQLFKQQPLKGKDPRPNPNSNNGTSNGPPTVISGSNQNNFRREYSQTRILGSLTSGAATHSRHSSQKVSALSPNPAEDVVYVKHVKSSQSPKSHATLAKARSMRRQQNDLRHHQPQINTLAGSEVQSQCGINHQNIQPIQPSIPPRAFTTLAAHNSGCGIVEDQANKFGLDHQTGAIMIPADPKMTKLSKGLKRIETQTSIGHTASMSKQKTKQLFGEQPANTGLYKQSKIVGGGGASTTTNAQVKKNSRMFQFDLNLAGRSSKQNPPKQLQNVGQSDQSNSMQLQSNVLNKAAMYDSTTNSKQNNSTTTTFLKKSLWLMTSVKSKAMREVVQNQQADCQACRYLRQQHLSHNCGSPQKRQGLRINDATYSSHKKNTLVQDSHNSMHHNSIDRIGVNGNANQNQTAIQMRHSETFGSNLKTRKGLQKINNFQQANSTYFGWMANPQASQVQLLIEKQESEFLFGLTQKNLDTKYLTSQEYYNSKIASDIMYNEPRHIVSVFKEYLIFDDFSEYLKRFYTEKEAHERLPRVFEFYEHYSKVFPNYVTVPESKFMFKNIERKQKLIDQRHQQLLKNQKRDENDVEQNQLDEHKLEKHSKLYSNLMFHSQFLKEVFADDDKLSIQDHNSLSQAGITNSQILEKSVSIDLKGLQMLNKNGKYKASDYVEDPRIDLQTGQPQAKLVKFNKESRKLAINGGRKVYSTNRIPFETSMQKHQYQLEKVIHMLSCFEQKTEVSISITISQSYLEASAAMLNPGVSSLNFKELAPTNSKKSLLALMSNDNFKGDNDQKKKERKSEKAKVIDPFTDGWNMGLEPAHDLSMSSWAFNSSHVDYLPFETQNTMEDNTAKKLSGDIQIGLAADQDKPMKNKYLDQKYNSTQNIPLKRKSVQPIITTPQIIDNNKGNNQLVKQNRQMLVTAKQGNNVSGGMRRRNSAVSQNKSNVQGGKVLVQEFNEQHIDPTSALNNVEVKSSNLVQSSRVDNKKGGQKKSNLRNSRCKSKLSLGSSLTHTNQNLTKHSSGNQTAGASSQIQGKNKIMKMIKESNGAAVGGMMLPHKTSSQISSKSGVEETAKNNPRFGPSVHKRVLEIGLSTGNQESKLAKQLQNPSIEVLAQSAQISSLRGGSKDMQQTLQKELNTRNPKVSRGTSGLIKNINEQSIQRSTSSLVQVKQSPKHGQNYKGKRIAGQKSVYERQGGEDNGPGLAERFKVLKSGSRGDKEAIDVQNPSMVKTLPHSKQNQSVFQLRKTNNEQQISANQVIEMTVNRGRGISGKVLEKSGSGNIGQKRNNLQQNVEKVLDKNQISPKRVEIQSQQSKIRQSSYKNLPIIFKKEDKKAQNLSPSSSEIQPFTNPNVIKQSQSQVSLVQKKGKMLLSVNQQTRQPSQTSGTSSTNLHQPTNYYSKSGQQSQIYPQHHQHNSQAESMYMPQQVSGVSGRTTSFQTLHGVQASQAQKIQTVKERQSKSESAQKHGPQKVGGLIAPNSTSSVMDHNLMLAQQNKTASQNFGNSNSVRHQSKDSSKMGNNMLIANNLTQNVNSLLTAQLSSNLKTNPYAKTGRIMSSLATQKQSVHSGGSLSQQSLGTNSQGGVVQSMKSRGKNLKILGNYQNNHALTTKQSGVTTTHSQSSSSSVRSYKISAVSTPQNLRDQQNSQVYLKTLARVLPNSSSSQNTNQTSQGSLASAKAALLMRKNAAAGSKTSSNKALKKSSKSSSTTAGHKLSTKASTKVSAGKSGTGSSQYNQNPYPVGASTGNTIFTVQYPTQQISASRTLKK